MGRILSGIKPTSEMTIGNYIGAIKNWVAMQNDYDEPFFFVADMHAITVPQDPKELHELTYHVVASSLASGIDPKKSTFFIQSQIPAHAELGWILQCHTSMGWLNRMTQFKDKAGKNKDKAMAGLYAYPSLMAADILMYHPTHVPVGDDQKQHVELTRDIVNSFNHRYGVEYFTIPEPVIQKTGARIMSLRDGTKKMSKSDPSDMSRINMMDDADLIAKKIKKATSDGDVLPETVDGLIDRAEAQNLITIYAALLEITPQDVLNEFAGKGFGDFKPALADVVVNAMSPISKKMHELLDDKAQLDTILSQGREKAAEVADKTVTEVKEILGFVATK